MATALNPGDRVYYRENGRTDKGTVKAVTDDAVTVVWDADGKEDEHEWRDVGKLPRAEQPKA